MLIVWIKHPGEGSDCEEDMRLEFKEKLWARKVSLEVTST